MAPLLSPMTMIVNSFDENTSNFDKTIQIVVTMTMTMTKLHAFEICIIPPNHFETGHMTVHNSPSL